MIKELPIYEAIKGDLASSREKNRTYLSYGSGEMGKLKQAYATQSIDPAITAQARALAMKGGPLKKNQRMLNSFMSLDTNPNPHAAKAAASNNKQLVGISTP